MVYMALTASLAAGGVWQGCCFYGNFRTWYFSIYVCRCTSRKLNEPGFENKSFKSYSYRYDYPWWAFILRGMEIGIPYLSPASEAMGISKDAASCHTPGHSSEEHSH